MKLVTSQKKIFATAIGTHLFSINNNLSHLTTSDPPHFICRESDYYSAEIVQLLHENPEEAQEILKNLTIIIENAPEYLKLIFPIPIQEPTTISPAENTTVAPIPFFSS